MKLCFVLIGNNFKILYIFFLEIIYLILYYNSNEGYIDIWWNTDSYSYYIFDLNSCWVACFLNTDLLINYF